MSRTKKIIRNNILSMQLYSTFASNGGMQVGITLGEMKNQISSLQQELKQIKADVKSECSSLAMKFDSMDKMDQVLVSIGEVKQEIKQVKTELASFGAKLDLIEKLLVSLSKKPSPPTTLLSAVKPRAPRSTDSKTSAPTRSRTSRVPSTHRSTTDATNWDESTWSSQESANSESDLSCAILHDMLSTTT